jgi:hypothetical protein
VLGLSGSARRARRRRREERPATQLRAATGRRSTLEGGSAPDRTPGHAVPTRAYQPRPPRRRAAGRSPRRTERPADADPRAMRLDKPHSISAVLGGENS